MPSCSENTSAGPGGLLGLGEVMMREGNFGRTSSWKTDGQPTKLRQNLPLSPWKADGRHSTGDEISAEPPPGKLMIKGAKFGRTSLDPLWKWMFRSRNFGRTSPWDRQQVQVSETRGWMESPNFASTIRSTQTGRTGGVCQ
jgi:hypothetical protein